jgi:L-erythro-3,5-diaminohexanoate dehydrogenase
MGKGNPFGTHRVLDPKGVLPQPAWKLNNDMTVLWDNEILLNIDMLNIDSASFEQIKGEAGGDEAKIKDIISAIVGERGKLQNPVTGSGGMCMGEVAAVGPVLARRGLERGDKLVSLVSLSLTPLYLEEILKVDKETDQVTVRGKAVLFESGIYTRLPEDLPPLLSLAVLDVCGAPAQTARLVKPGDTVVIMGATGKSGMLCAYEAAKRAGKNGKVIGLGHSEGKCKTLEKLKICHEVLPVDAVDALRCYERVSDATQGQLADVVINCVNIPNTEMASVLMCREAGTVYFFSMATSFTRAALGAEGVGKDISMVIGNGYVRSHAESALGILRESGPLRRLYERLYVPGNTGKTGENV